MIFCSSGSCTTSFLITNQPGFWDIIRQPNIHIHRTGIRSILRSPEQNSLGSKDSGIQIQLDNETHVSEIELLILATGWKKSLPFKFNPPELPEKLGLPYEHSIRDEDPSLEAQAEIDKTVKHWKSLETLAQQLEQRNHIPDVLEDPQNDPGPTDLVFPLRLFRNMVSPELTTSLERDRSLLVLGMAKSWQTMIVSEVQALWGAVYLLGGFDGNGAEEKERLDFATLGKNGIEERIAVFEEFSKSTGGGVLLVDSLKYCDILLRDLGLNPWRKSMGGGWWNRWRDWVGVHRPEDYAGIVGEWMDKNKTMAIGN